MKVRVTNVAKFCRLSSYMCVCTIIFEVYDFWPRYLACWKLDTVGSCSQFKVTENVLLKWSARPQVRVFQNLQSAMLKCIVVPSSSFVACTCEGRTAVHRAVEVHGQASDMPTTDQLQLHGLKDSTDIIRLLVLHGADINQPVSRIIDTAVTILS